MGLWWGDACTSDIQWGQNGDKVEQDIMCLWACFTITRMVEISFRSCEVAWNEQSNYILEIGRLC